MTAASAGLAGKTDDAVFAWAQEQGAIVITFDEDFADQRAFPTGLHAGVVRLRVNPTTVEATKASLTRLLGEVEDDLLGGALVVVTAARIRVIRP
jgi:predicted nuclease of predicted toxin-antitoxin system